MAASNPRHKAVVIDTENYAGNFERELCAFVTGQYGECGVGSELAEEAAAEIAHIGWWSEHVRMEADENGCSRPASIWPTPGWFNNGMGGNYRDDPENLERAHADLVEAERRYFSPHIAKAQKRLDDGDFEADKPGAWTKEACEREVGRCQARIAKAGEKMNKWPAYFSVAIFIDEFPPQEALDELETRVQAFSDMCAAKKQENGYGQGAITVTGIRLLDPTMKAEPPTASTSP